MYYGESKPYKHDKTSNRKQSNWTLVGLKEKSTDLLRI